MMSKRKPTKEESDHAYWVKEFDRARDLVDDFVRYALDNEELEPEALSMWLLDWACQLQREIDEGDEEEARRTILEEVDEFFRNGQLPTRKRCTERC